MPDSRIAELYNAVSLPSESVEVFQILVEDAHKGETEGLVTFFAQDLIKAVGVLQALHNNQKDDLICNALSVSGLVNQFFEENYPPKADGQIAVAVRQLWGIVQAMRPDLRQEIFMTAAMVSLFTTYAVDNVTFAEAIQDLDSEGQKKVLQAPGTITAFVGQCFKRRDVSVKAGFGEAILEVLEAHKDDHEFLTYVLGQDDFVMIATQGRWEIEAKSKSFASEASRNIAGRIMDIIETLPSESQARIMKAGEVASTLVKYGQTQRVIDILDGFDANALAGILLHPDGSKNNNILRNKIIATSLAWSSDYEIRHWLLRSIKRFDLEKTSAFLLSYGIGEALIFDQESANDVFSIILELPESDQVDVLCSGLLYRPGRRGEKGHGLLAFGLRDSFNNLLRQFSPASFERLKRNMPHSDYLFCLE